MLYALLGDLIIFLEVFTAMELIAGLTILGVIVGVAYYKLKLKNEDKDKVKDDEF